MGKKLNSRQLDESARRRLNAYTKNIGGCTVYQRYTDPNGYGKISYRGKPEYAHRVSFTLAGGVLIKGMDLDHLCRNTSCVNPEHLEQVTHAENLYRSPIAIAAINKRKRVCIRGHIDGFKTRGKARLCSECQHENDTAQKKYDRMKEYYLRKKATLTQQD